MGDSVDAEKWKGKRMDPMCFRLKTRYNSMTDWLRWTEEGSPAFGMQNDRRAQAKKRGASL